MPFNGDKSTGKLLIDKTPSYNLSRYTDMSCIKKYTIHIRPRTWSHHELFRVDWDLEGATFK